MKAAVSESGFTLIESVFTISIIAIAMTGLVAVWSNAASRSADPYWQSKTNALGKFYTRQIHARPYHEITDYRGEIRHLNDEKVDHYDGFSAQLDVSAAGSEFELPNNHLKKIKIRIIPPTGSAQEFVVYRGRY